MLTKLCLLAVLLLVSFAVSAQPTGHPRLFFGAADTAAISARTRVPGSAASQLFAEVLESASHYTNLGYMWHSTWHHKSIFYDNLHAIAFAYLVTHQTNYADRAKELVFRTDPTFNQQGIIWDQYPDGGAALRSKVIALSIVYDWLFEQLSQSERRAIQDTIIQNLAYPGGEGIRDYFLRPDVDLNRHEFRPEPAL